MRTTLKPVPPEKKKEILRVIRSALKEFNSVNPPPPDYAREVINAQAKNIRLAADTFEYGPLQMIVDYRFSIEVIMLILEIEALAPDDLRELKEKLLHLAVKKKRFW